MVSVVERNDLGPEFEVGPAIDPTHIRVSDPNIINRTVDLSAVGTTLVVGVSGTSSTPVDLTPIVQAITADHIIDASYNGATGDWTFTREDASTFVINTTVENFLASGVLDANNDLVLTLVDGSVVTIPLDALVNVLTSLVDNLDGSATYTDENAATSQFDPWNGTRDAASTIPLTEGVYKHAVADAVALNPAFAGEMELYHLPGSPTIMSLRFIGKIVGSNILVQYDNVFDVTNGNGAVTTRTFDTATNAASINIESRDGATRSRVTLDAPGSASTVTSVINTVEDAATGRATFDRGQFDSAAGTWSRKNHLVDPLGDGLFSDQDYDPALGHKQELRLIEGNEQLAFTQISGQRPDHLAGTGTQQEISMVKTVGGAVIGGLGIDENGLKAMTVGGSLGGNGIAPVAGSQLVANANFTTLEWSQTAVVDPALFSMAVDAGTPQLNLAYDGNVVASLPIVDVQDAFGAHLHWGLA